eukprot:1066735-Pelagomonas_calceolata.AAC.2
MAENALELPCLLEPRHMALANVRLESFPCLCNFSCGTGMKSPLPAKTNWQGTWGALVDLTDGAGGSGAGEAVPLYHCHGHLAHR